MKFFIKILKDFPSYLWGGWASIASIFLFFALWDFGHQIYGDLILPSPKDTFIAMSSILQDSSMQNEIMITLKKSIKWFWFSNFDWLYFRTSCRTFYNCIYYEPSNSHNSFWNATNCLDSSSHDLVWYG